MRIIFFISLLFLAHNIHAQNRIIGDLLNDNRNIVNDIDYKIDYTKSGQVTVDINVNIDGKVTSADVDENNTDIVSTPLEIKAINRAKKLKFGRCYRCPEFHKGSVVFQVQEKAK